MARYADQTVADRPIQVSAPLYVAGA
jgi:hypothetical protein